MVLCAVSRWCEGCRNKGKAQLSSALDRISERITLAFQTLSRPEAIRGSPVEKHKFTLYFNRIWRRECQSIPIDVQAVLRSSTWEPTVLATSNWPIPCARRAPSLCAIFRRPRRSRRKKVKGLIAANDFLGLRSEEQGRRHRTAILAVGFRNSARSRMPCVEGPAVLPFCSSKLAHS
jgi:hypothetical protein